MESDIGFDRRHRPVAIVLMKSCEARGAHSQSLSPEGVDISLALSGSPDMLRMPTITLILCQARLAMSTVGLGERCWAPYWPKACWASPRALNLQA